MSEQNIPNTPPAPEQFSNPVNSSFNQSFGNNNMPPRPDNYMVLAIVATVVGACSCLPLILGVVAIIFASQVESKYRLGDYIGAESSSKNSKLLSIISLVVSAVSIIFVILYWLFVGVALQNEILQNGGLYPQL